MWKNKYVLLEKSGVYSDSFGKCHERRGYLHSIKINDIAQRSICTIQLCCLCWTCIPSSFVLGICRVFLCMCLFSNDVQKCCWSWHLHNVDSIFKHYETHKISIIEPFQGAFNHHKRGIMYISISRHRHFEFFHLASITCKFVNIFKAQARYQKNIPKK